MYHYKICDKHFAARFHIPFSYFKILDILLSGNVNLENFQRQSSNNNAAYGRKSKKKKYNTKLGLTLIRCKRNVSICRPLYIYLTTHTVHNTRANRTCAMRRRNDIIFRLDKCFVENVSVSFLYCLGTILYRQRHSQSKTSREYPERQTYTFHIQQLFRMTCAYDFRKLFLELVMCVCVF